jgi:uncharacterized protein (TIGR02231 family)
MEITNLSKAPHWIFGICRVVFFLLVFHIPNLQASQEAQPIKVGKIQKVRLYTDRAEIFRQASIQLPTGSSDIVIGPFPSSLLTDSIRISPRTNSPIQIGHFSVEKTYQTRFLDDSIQKQEVRVDQFLLNLNSIQDELVNLKHQLNYIENLSGGKNQSNITPGPDYWDSILEFKATRGKIKRDQFRETLVKSQIAEKELKVEEKKLADMRVGTKKEANNIHINLRSNKPMAGHLDISYQIRNTSWKPTYRLRTNTRQKSIAFEYIGQISQKTGENWKDVLLELTTSQPSRGTTPPKLYPWVIDYPKKFSATAEANLFKRKGRALMQEAPQRDSNILMNTKVIQSGVSFTYRIPGKQTIATGTNSYRSLIFSDRFDAELIYTAIPKNVQNVFLKAKTKNSSPYHLLPGPIKNFVDGSFVGNSWIKNIAPEQEMEMGLGLDESIKVERKLIKKEGGEDGIFNQTQKQRYTFEITLENFKDVPIQVELKDQLPLSYQEEIKVRINQIKPEPDHTDKQNFLNWKISLAPKERKMVTLDFQVEYPEGKTVRGL